MAQLKLGPDEYVVLKSVGVLHGGGLSSHTDDLVLSNQNIILISKGMLGNTKSVEYFSLNSIKYIDGKSQAIATGPKLDVYFLKEQDSFVFKSKRDAKAWASAIAKLLSENVGNSGADRDKAIPGAAYIADTLKDTLDTFRDTFRRK